MNPFYMPRLLTCFMAGAAVYLNRHRVPINGTLFVAAAIVLATTVRLAIWPCLVLPTAGLYCLLYVACLQCKPTNAVGRQTDLSYGVYLYAYPIQQLLVMHGFGAGRPWRLTGWALGPALVVAWFSWTFVERPVLRYKPTYFRRPLRPDSSADRPMVA